MNELAQLMETIKRQLKAKGLTYRDVGRALKISEPSVKRLFSTKRLTVDRLAQLAGLLEFTLAELLQEAAAAPLQIHMLSKEQELQLVSKEALLLVAVCALNHWSLADIVAAYRLTRAECLKHLLVLDRMGMIELLPGDRIRLRVARDFDWLPDGPIERFFQQQGLQDFIDSKFDRQDETLEFAHGMLTNQALAQLQIELRRVRSKLAALHEESAVAPLSQRRGVGLLLAMREWEPRGFRGLRRMAPSE
jgi:transcriptional regulator with XRE-family HTH domain